MQSHQESQTPFFFFFFFFFFPPPPPPPPLQIDLRGTYERGRPLSSGATGFRRRLRDSGKDRCLDHWVGEETLHGTRAHAIGRFGDSARYEIRAANIDPSRMDVRRLRVTVVVSPRTEPPQHQWRGALAYWPIRPLPGVQLQQAPRPLQPWRPRRGTPSRPAGALGYAHGDRHSPRRSTRDAFRVGLSRQRSVAYRSPLHRRSAPTTCAVTRS